MKTIIALALLTVSLFATDKYVEPEFYSVGMLPDGHKFVCLDGEKWIQKKEPDMIVLKKMYYYDDELKKDIPLKCN